MSNFLDRLLLRCDQHDDVLVTANEVVEWSAGELDWCLASGILVDGPPATELVCHECAVHPAERVVWLGGAVGEARAYLPCSNCGPVLVPAEQLRRWQLVLLKLWELAFTGGDMEVNVREIVPRRLWRIGKADWGKATWEVLVGRLLWRPDAADALRRVRLSSRSVIFLPDGVPEFWDREHHGRIKISLRETLTWTGLGLALDLVHARQLLQEAICQNPSRLPRPTRKRAGRAATIETLTKLLKEHVEAAREHARATAERGLVELLPRPTQRDLARQAGLSEISVSRSFRDPAARELRLLWDLAGDLDRLQNLTAIRR